MGGRRMPGQGMGRCAAEGRRRGRKGVFCGKTAETGGNFPLPDAGRPAAEGKEPRRGGGRKKVMPAAQNRRGGERREEPKARSKIRRVGAKAEGAKPRPKAEAGAEEPFSFPKGRMPRPFSPQARVFPGRGCEFFRNRRFFFASAKNSATVIIVPPSRGDELFYRTPRNIGSR